MYPVEQSRVSPAPLDGLDHHIDLWSPAAPGSFPVILFLPGMACMVPATAYSNLLSTVINTTNNPIKTCAQPNNMNQIKQKNKSLREESLH